MVYLLDNSFMQIFTAVFQKSFNNSHSTKWGKVGTVTQCLEKQISAKTKSIEVCCWRRLLAFLFLFYTCKICNLVINLNIMHKIQLDTCLLTVQVYQESCDLLDRTVQQKIVKMINCNQKILKRLFLSREMISGYKPCCKNFTFHNFIALRPSSVWFKSSGGQVCSINIRTTSKRVNIFLYKIRVRTERSFQYMLKLMSKR